MGTKAFVFEWDTGATRMDGKPNYGRRLRNVQRSHGKVVNEVVIPGNGQKPRAIKRHYCCGPFNPDCSNCRVFSQYRAIFVQMPGKNK